MPKDNIERAIKRGTGELEGSNVEEVLYEGYGPHGVAVMCDIMTDNRNRTAAEIRKLFDVHGGKLGATNCVAWMFDRKGLFVIDGQAAGEETLTEIALEAGADDVKRKDEKFEITCDPERYSDVDEALGRAEIETESKQIASIPSNTVELELHEARQVLKLLEALDDHDDVQNVSANLDISEEALAEMSES